MRKGNTFIGGLLSFLNKRKSLSIFIFLLIFVSGIIIFNSKNSSRAKYYRFRENAIAHAKACLPEGEMFLSKVIEINPNDDIAYYYLGIAKLCNKRNFYDAIYLFQKAIEINPNNYLAYEQMAKAKFKLEDYEGAIYNYKKVLELRPEEVYIYAYMGLAKYNLDNYSGAIEDYTKSIKLFPNNKEIENVYFNRGLSRFYSKDYIEAISDYSKVLDINPQKYNALFWRGLSKSQLGDKWGACKDFRKTMLIKNELLSGSKELIDDASQIYNQECGEFFDVMDLYIK